MREVSKEELAKHASEKDCWVAIGGKVYDVTSFLSEHPGGGDPITDVAGTDATRQFAEIGHSDEALTRREDFLIGTLEGVKRAPKSADATLNEISPEELAKHTTAEDCWVAVHGLVYDVTKFLLDHPGGVEVIVDVSGRDATRQFAEIGHSEEARATANGFVVGKLQGAAQVKRLVAPKAKKPKSTPLPEPDAPSEADAYIFAAAATAAVVAAGVFLARAL
ncbi:Cytochrome b5 [Hondaea fermentalgiana]|uniref:Cytochrome b5 n=1 Tax=Hondaea fermentalgiana TaxID=2315210 RepID=A0A2R5G998_9STRA|nr:Cytochrome b5 [Hondaea fermentalgiana]|eukprot:GBG24274.1 Cytochrome b5 [Hondaea fermentalgiana]